MDFTFGEEQVLVRDLAREILASEITLERLKAIEAEGAAFSPALWSQLAAANLLGIAVPEAQGGMGLSLLELCALLQEIGRAVAPVPTLASLALAGLPLARAGTKAQQERWLPALARGEAILAAALVDAGSADPAAPATRAGARARASGSTARSSASRWRTPRSSCWCRPPATPARASSCSIRARPACGSRSGSARDAGRASPLTLDGSRGGAGRARRRGLRRRRAAALAGRRGAGRVAATQIGVSERALEITARYVKQRVQFGAPIGSFPAVQHRGADAWIDLEALRWTTWRAVWKLAHGERPPRGAGREVLGGRRRRADRDGDPASARRHGRRSRLSRPPPLPVVEGARARARRRHAAPRAPRPRAGPQRAAGAAMTAKSPALSRIQVGDALPELRVPLTSQR